MSAVILQFPTPAPAAISIIVYLLCASCKRKRIVRVSIAHPSAKSMEAAGEEAQNRAAALARLEGWRRDQNSPNGLLCSHCAPRDNQEPSAA